MKTKNGGPLPLASIYGLSAGLALLILVAVGVFSGPGAIFAIIILALLEITFSFDNAVLNSQILAKLNKAWQEVFLTVGIAIAVFGVRLLLPIILVASTTGNSMKAVLDLALHHPEEYAHSLELGYPIIAAFGGVFLLMIGFRFFGEDRKIRWWHQVEGPLGEFNQPWWVVAAGSAAAIGIIGLFLAPGQSGPLIGAICGAAAFVAVKGIGELLLHRRGPTESTATASGWHALSLFLYLELLDASFSFDGVVAAFAITKDIVLIAAGLGIGALFVRSMTIHLLQHGTIAKFRYLIHGAHYAVLLLGVLMLTSIRFHLPEVVTGLAGIVILSLAIFSSWRHEQQEAIQAKN